MKTRFLIWSLMAMGSFSAVAQQVEIDDMYFTSKDRVAMNSTREALYKTSRTITEESSPLNPTDSYSARNVNPEYISRAKMDPNSQHVAVPYFIPDYQPKAINQNLSYSNYTNNSGWSNSSWNNPYYNNFNSGFGGFGNRYSPYNSFGYNSFDPYGFNGFNNYNYYGSPWTNNWLMMSMGYGFGGWNMWGSQSMNFYGNNFYGNPYCYNSISRYNPFYNPYNSFANVSYTAATVSQERGMVDGRKSVRGSEIDTYYAKPGSRFAESGENSGGRFSGNGVSSTNRNDSQQRTNWGSNTRSYQQTWGNSWGDSGSRSNSSSSFSSGGNSGRSSFSTGGSSGGSSGASSGGGSRRGRD